jgi:hypothetical protein
MIEESKTTGEISALAQIPVFFIIGRGRSGSTLLRSILDAHPQLKIPLESRFVQFLYYKYYNRKKWSADEVSAIIDELENGFETITFEREEFLADIRNQGITFTLPEICKLVYLHSRSEFPKKDIKCFGDKNPRYSFFVPQLIKLFPEARFIHLVRDYRDNIAAVKRGHKKIKESGNLYFSVSRWQLYNKVIAKNQQKYPERFLTLRYEDIVINPGEEIRKLCQFLSIDFLPEMLDYHQKLGNYFKDEKFKELHISLEQPFDKSKIGVWRNELSMNQVKNAEILVGSFPERFNYMPEFFTGSIRKILILLTLYPVFLIGQLRFRLKHFLYRFPLLMKFVYHLLLKLK